ncbi:NADH-quinone oxidoreductase subunit J [Thiorhodospira sibirica]|uniref:NADH-quinone oxidoreductase subunit J n=1 Tax=Thiorhodospira sibirica TaxID=154347 RepID=UPI00022C528E|nr:NADH-quinone oxidoreductase subunit J [Thiorhodospira sibirica]
MTLELAVFYGFAAVLVLASLLMITVRNPVHAALSLVAAFFAAAVLWVLLEAEFLGIVLVLVYVGAVMVLFLFVVMTLDLNVSQLREGFVRYLPIGGLVALVMGAGMIWVLTRETVFERTTPLRAGADYNNTLAIGQVLYTEYVYPFEIAAVILLVAVIAAITLTLDPRRRRTSKSIDPAEAVKVRAKDRIKMVDLRQK